MTTSEMAIAIWKMLDASKTGKGTEQLWEKFRGPDTHIYDFHAALNQLRHEGTIACANDIWYLRARKYDPPQPKRPRKPTVAQEKFLKKQGRLF